MPLKLLVLSSTFPRFEGDQEPPFVFELCKRLTEYFDVTVLVPHAKGLPLCEMMGGVKVVRFRYAPEAWQTLAYNGGILPRLKEKPLRYLLLPCFMFGQWWAMFKLLRQQSFDVVHAHWLIPQGLIAALMPSCPRLVVTSHGSDLHGLRGKLLSMLKSWVIKKSKPFVVVSQAMVDDARLLVSANLDIKVISMGVDLQHLFVENKRVIREDTQLLFVGRLIEKKGIAYLLLAVAEVKKYEPAIKLLIIGDGPERVALEQQCHDLALTHNVEFLGRVPNQELPFYFQQSTIFVMPSMQEGLGLVAVEAMGCGCSVIASDLPAIRDVVINEQTGLSVPIMNAMALYQAICRLLEQPALRQELARNALKYVRLHFDWGSIVERYQQELSGRN